jgi:hypothetical protein
VYYNIGTTIRQPFRLESGMLSSDAPSLRLALFVKSPMSQCRLGICHKDDVTGLKTVAHIGTLGLVAHTQRKNLEMIVLK